MAIKKSDLCSSLWASCDPLRGGMNASQAELEEVQGSEDGIFSGVGSITAVAVKERLFESGGDPDGDEALKWVKQWPCPGNRMEMVWT